MTRSPLVLLVLAVPGLLLAVPVPAHAAEAPTCAVTGHAAGSGAEAAALREALATTPAHQLAGVPLEHISQWTVPAGSEPVLVLDATGRLAGDVDATVSMFGVSRPVDLGFDGTAGDRLVSESAIPAVGGTTRTALLQLDGDECAAAVAITADRSVFSTAAGLVGLASAVSFGTLLVVVARRRTGGWTRRFLLAAPLGFLAGAGEAVLLHDAGVFDPSTRTSWWIPVAAVVLAAALPWTRRRPPTPSTPDSPPTHAPLGSWRLGHRFTVAGPFEVWHASADDPPRRGLVKVAAVGRASEPAVRDQLTREADVLSRLDHPNCVRLEETLTGDGLLTIVMEHVDGTTLRAVADAQGRLPGPQAVAVVLGMLAGVGAVHGLELVHRAVRPEHIWLDADGRVLLAGFELACPGIENSIAAAGDPPYASPEQRRGDALDPRSDLWSCAAILRELLTGHAIDGHASNGHASDGQAIDGEQTADGPPAPLAEVLERALAPAPAGRPHSTAQFAEQLRLAAAEAYGPDWAGRAALGAALLSHAAAGSAIAGYAMGGAGPVAGAGGSGLSGLGAARAESVGSRALGEASSATAQASGHASTAAAGADPGATVGAGTGGTSTGGPGSGATPSAGAPVGKAGTVAAPAAAAAVAVVAGVAGIVAGPQPAEAVTEVVTPAAAEVIFVRTMDEARADDYQHLTEEATEQVAELWTQDEAARDADLVEIVVGVPPEQYDYPAWFVASAELHFDGTVVYLFARFDRPSSDEAWLATVLGWSLDQVMTPPALDANGWLAPPPQEADPDDVEPTGLPEDVVLVVDPAVLPDRYATWFERSFEAGEVLDDEILAIHPDQQVDPGSGNTSTIQLFTTNVFTNDPSSTFSKETVVVPDATGLSARWHSQREAIVSFPVTIEYTQFNSPERAPQPCGPIVVGTRGEGAHQQYARDWHTTVEAYVPIQQPWRGDLDELAPQVVLIDDTVDRDMSEPDYVPERSIPC